MTAAPSVPPAVRRSSVPSPNSSPGSSPENGSGSAPVWRSGRPAPFAIIGFFVVALCTVLLVVSYARLAVINDQAVQLKSQLTDLKTTETTLLAQYELAYDLSAIEEQLTSNGSMVKLQPSQITYLDISAPDSVIVYDNSGQGISGLVHELESFFAQLMS